MNPFFLKAVELLELGTRIHLCEPCSGGQLHRMWRVKTDQGIYVFKIINPYVVKKQNFPSDYETAEDIANLFAQQNVPAIAALQYHGHHVHQIDDTWFMVFPYCEGQIMEVSRLQPAQLERIGDIFARLHLLKLQHPRISPAKYFSFNDHHWQSLLSEADIEPLLELLPVLLRWNQRFHGAIPVLNQDLVITHCDLHPNNVLWDRQLEPYVIDWESAGLMNPLLEVIGYGMEWGDILSGSFQESHTLTILKGYQEKTQRQVTQQNIAHAFYGWLGHCVLGWTEFNLRRLLGHISAQAEEKERGSNIIHGKMIPCLQFIQSQEHYLIEHIEAVLL